jgi:N,N'-diacetyllegionaminate synthase
MAKSAKVLIIAEVGSVHDGSFGNATKLIDVAAECGADAVKFQTHIAEAETLRGAPMPPYFKGEPRFEYFQRTGFTPEQWGRLKAHCDGRGVEFMSSPFSEEAVDLLEKVGVARYKIPSGEVTNLPMLERIAATGKPVLLSSGMSDWKELDAAMAMLRKGKGEVTVLQCATEYPCADSSVGLNVLAEMKARWGSSVGFSDHTLENHAAFAAVALGAVAVEKHLTFSKRMYGSDAPHSAEPAQFADLVKGIRAISTMLASPVDKSSAEAYRSMKQIFEKSVVSVVAIPAGTVITKGMLGIKKPGSGIPAASIGEVIGARASRDIPADHLIAKTDLRR